MIPYLKALINLVISANETNRINVPTVPIGNVAIGRSNRESNGDAMQIGMLQQLTLPTGGTQAFDYEANQFKLSDQLVQEIRLVPDLSTCPVNEVLSCCGINTVIGESFQLSNATELAETKIAVKLSSANLPDPTLSNCGNNFYIAFSFAELIRTSDGANIGSISGNIAVVEGEYKTETLQIPLSDFAINQAINLNEAHHFELSSIDGEAQLDLFKEVTTNQADVIEVGGLRI